MSETSDEALAETQVEASGETVGEAKWAALRELEGRFPGLDKRRVRFQVLAEGERGLLGIGFTPARVLAEALPGAQSGGGGAPKREREPKAPREEPGSPEAKLRELVETVCSGLGLRATVTVSHAGDVLVARISGSDLGLLIGKRGQTIDAIQYLANAALRADGTARDVVVDAAGYRARRQATLERAAEEAAQEALAAGGAVPLEPMSAPERKIVHLYLQRRGGVSTESDGAEPNRRVVVSPGSPDPAEE
jgi:spoIIIJ-associated protein